MGTTKRFYLMWIDEVATAAKLLDEGTGCVQTVEVLKELLKQAKVRGDTVEFGVANQTTRIFSEKEIIELLKE